MNKNASTVRNWLLCYAIYVCGGIPILVSPVVKILSDKYPDVPLETVRSITTIPSLIAFALALFLASWVGKKISYRRALLTGMFLCVVGGIFPAFVHRSFSQILAARVVFGLGFSVFSMRNAIATHTFGEENAAMWMGYGLFLQNGSSVALQLISGRLGDIDWRYSFLLYLVVLTAFFIVLLLYPKEPRDTAALPAEPADRKEWRQALPPLRVVIYALVTLGGALCTFPVLSSASVFLSERGLGTASESSMVVSAYTVGSALLSAGFGRAYRRLRRWTIPIGCAVCGSGFALLLAARSVWVAALGSGLCGAGFAWILLTHSTWAKDAASPERRAISMTLITSFVSGGSFLSSYFIRFARRVGALIPLFRTELEKTFLVSVLLYLCLGLIHVLWDFSPSAADRRSRQDAH